MYVGRSGAQSLPHLIFESELLSHLLLSYSYLRQHVSSCIQMNPDMKKCIIQKTRSYVERTNAYQARQNENEATEYTCMACEVAPLTTHKGLFNVIL